MVVRIDQLLEEVLGRAQRKFQERRRLGVGKANGSDENFVEDTNENRRDFD